MRRGYSLLEICAVMLIIGIVFSVAIPRLVPRLAETRLDTSARQIATFCRYLNAQAVLTKVQHTLYVDVDAGEYWVTIIVTSGDGGFLWGSDIDAEELEVTSDLLNRRRLPEGVHFQDVSLSLTGGADRGMVALNFTPVGPMERMLVHLVSDAGSQLTVFLDPVTGATGVLEGYAEALNQRSLG
jgi:prepilin-type N-terminal cleavage/methylation domain-containing protein